MIAGRAMLPRLTAAVLLVAAMSVPMSAQDAGTGDVRVHMETDSSRLRIGEWMGATITVDAPADARVRMPATAADFAHAEVVSTEKPAAERSGDRMRYTRRLVLTAFDTGAVELRALVRYTLPGDTTALLAQSNPVTVTVRTVQVDTTKTFRDIRDVVDVPLPWWAYLLYALGALALGYAAWWLYRRWKRRPVEEPVVEAVTDEEPDFVVALRRLRALEDGQVWQRGEDKVFQSELSETLREYIERHYGLHALEQVTGEIVAGVARLGLPPALIEGLERTLHTADATKYAKYRPTGEEHHNGLRFSYGFVERTSHRDTSQHDGSGPTDERGAGGA